MNKSVAMKWVKALRSGKYKQATQQLRTSSGYCCLGVLCDIAPKTIKLSHEFMDEDADSRVISGDTLESQPDVQDWAGLEGPCGNFPPDIKPKGVNVEVDTLADLNDRGWSFRRIATFIEKNWKKL